MSDREPTFTGQQAAQAQTALRQELGLAAEQFPLQAFVGMISDEIEQLRSQGRTDVQIAALIEKAIGTKIPAEQVTQFYASPEARGRH